MKTKFENFQNMFQDFDDIDAHFSCVYIGRSKSKRRGKRSKYAIVPNMEISDDGVLANGRKPRYGRVRYKDDSDRLFPRPIEYWPTVKELAINARDNNGITSVWSSSLRAIAFDIDGWQLIKPEENMQVCARRFIQILGKTPFYVHPSSSGQGFHVWVLKGDDVPSNHPLISSPQKRFLIHNQNGIRKLSGEVFYDTFNPLFIYSFERFHSCYFNILNKIYLFTKQNRKADINRFVMREGDCHRFDILFCRLAKKYTHPVHTIRLDDDGSERKKRNSKSFKNLESALDTIRNLPLGEVYGPSYFPAMISKLMRSELIKYESDTNIDDVILAYLERNSNYSYEDIQKRIVSCVRWWLNQSNHQRPSS